MNDPTELNNTSDTAEAQQSEIDAVGFTYVSREAQANEQDITLPFALKVF